MIAYIKSVKSWETLAYAVPVKWTAPLLSSDNAPGQFVFMPEALPEGIEGEWLVYAGKAWVVDSISSTETELTVTVRDAFAAFYRQHVYPSGHSTVGGFLTAIFNTNYRDNADAEYAMPYLVVDNEDTTPMIEPGLEDELFFVAADYLRRVTQLGVGVEFEPKNDGLYITIYTQPSAPRNVIDGDGHFELVSVTKSSSIVSKVTARRGNVRTDYYLWPNGSISTTEPTTRVKGRWEQIRIGDSDITESEQVKAVFEENTASLKVEFYSDKEYRYGERLRLLVRGKLYDATVAYVEKSSEDTRTLYKAGRLPTSLTDKLRLALGGM